jgi:predicted HTH transcriptional regulator
MPLDAISIDSLSEAHLQELIPNQERENTSIEFKGALPGNSYEDRKEFLADFTSFANTVGGDLIFGVRAPNGIAEEVD